MGAARKLCEQIWMNSAAITTIETNRLQHKTLEEIADLLRKEGFVDSATSVSVLISAVSTVARDILGTQKADDIARANRHVLTDEEIAAARRGQPLATIAAVKARGQHLWSPDDDQLLCEIVEAYEPVEGESRWHGIAKAMQGRSINVSAQACKMRHYKLTQPMSESCPDKFRQLDQAIGVAPLVVVPPEGLHETS